MSDVKTIRRSFAGGEIAPELFGRMDLTKFQTGLARAYNFRVLPHGPAVNREGTAFVAETAFGSAQSRLLPFVLSGQATYVLEFGGGYIRFFSNGQAVLEATKNITAITQANPGVVTSNAHGYGNGQWVYVTGVGGMTQINGRFYVVANATANTFTLTDMAGAAINTSSFGAYTSGGTAARVYAISSPYDAADVFEIRYAQANNVLTLTHPSYAARELVYTSPTSWALNTINFNTPIAAPANVTATPTVNAGAETMSWYSYAVTAVNVDEDESQMTQSDSGSPINGRLWNAGNRHSISWDQLTGASYYNVYKSFAGAAATQSGDYGFIGRALDQTNPSFSDNNIEPDFSRAPPENQSILASTNNYPGAAAYFEQRRFFAGSNNDTQTVWATRIGSDQNMAKSTPIQDSDAFSFRMASLHAQQIRHLVPLEDLLLLTDTHVWRVYSTSDSALSATTVKPRAIAAVGASYVQPAVTSTSVLFEEKGTGHVIELRYSWEQNGYADSDVSLMAPHLFDNFSLRGISYSSKLKTMWAVRSDGALLGCTYIPQHEVLGWHQHQTAGGVIESVVTVAEGAEDGTYLVVRRTISGRTVRYIERLKARAATLVDSFFVDCGLTYSGSAATVISNLHHLEGATVAILADGVVHPTRVVSGGSITLEAAASKVHVGLPITSQAQLLPLEYETAGFGVGDAKNINKAHLRVYASSGLMAGPSFSKLREFPQRTSEPYGSPPALMTRVASIPLDPQWTSDGQLCVQQTLPLPVSLLSISLEVAVGG